MSSTHPVQVVAVTGGKGGVGKTNISVNMSIALAKMGRRVALMDADLGLANVDVLLGINARHNLANVMAGQCSLQDIVLDGPGGIKVIPASSGTQSMVSMTPMEHAGLIHAFSELSGDLDMLVVDTAAGISDTVISFVRASQEVLVVVCDEPSSITDAYALIKLLNRDYDMNRFHVVANMTRSTQEGHNLFTKLHQVCDRFLDVTLRYSGDIPFDEAVRKAVQRQKPLLLATPGSRAALAIKALAEKVNGWPVPTSPRGHLEFFVERLLGVATAG